MVRVRVLKVRDKVVKVARVRVVRISEPSQL